MNWQAVVDSLRHEQREWTNAAHGLNENSAMLVLGNAALLKALADSLQMGINKRNVP